MGYSLRTRSASKSEIETLKMAVASKPSVKKTAPAKKTTEIKKVEKKTEFKKIEKKTEIKKVAEPKKAAKPKKPAAKQAAKKVAAPKTVAKKTATPAKAKAETEASPSKAADKTEIKNAAPAKTTVKKAPAAKASPAKTPVKKVTSKSSPAKKAAPAIASATKKTTAVSKPAAKKAASTPKKSPIRKIAAPIVNIEEISSPSLPEVEQILPKEPEEEKVIEIVEGQVVSTHIRFSDDESGDIDMTKSSTEAAEEDEIVEASKEVSIHSSDFEALDDFKEEPTHFELYNSESEIEEIDQYDKISKDEFDDEELKEEEEVKNESSVINAHSAFEAFTSQEKPKTFNWNNSGSTYYQKPAVEEIKSDEVKNIEPIEDEKPLESVEPAAPTVISNPFGFGFTSTVAPSASASAPAPVSISKPNPFSFNSHFQSVSSPLDKLCNLTSKANPLPVSSSNFSFGTSSIGTSSFLPTSPATGFSKAIKSPSEKAEDKEERSPSVIQSIIIDDKHEDFSAF